MFAAASRLLFALLLVGGMAAGLAARPANAANTSADAWISVSGTTPAPGCAIDIAIELRSGGNPLTAADVQTALHAGDEVVSVDEAITGDDGVAHLTVEASGADGWLDINVGGGYLTGVAIAPSAGNDCTSGGVSRRVSADVSYEPLPAAPDSADHAGDGSGVTFWVPEYHQDRGLSCEYASLHIATGAWLNPISEYAFDEAVGWSANPHYGYRGDINGSWGNTDDYGVYAEPLAAALPQFGFQGTVFYGQGDTSQLRTQLDAGNPVLVWVALFGDLSERIADETGSYTVVPGMHVVVAHGYDDAGVYVSDPGTGVYRFFSWGDFMTYWNVLDGMSLAVTPA